MKLNELLLMPKYRNLNVKVGSKSGSSFWYCGKAGKGCLKDIERAYTYTLPQSKVVLRNLEKRLEHLDEIYEGHINQAMKRHENSTEKKMNNYLKMINAKWKEEKVWLPKKIKSVQNDLATHFLDRTVVEVVKGISPDEEPCYVVYVKGNERGRFWTIKEYQKVYKEKTK